MPTRRAVLAALAGSVGGVERLRRAMATVRREAAMPTAPIRCLAGDGAGLVWANGGPPGSDLIWVRPVNATTGEPPTLARNPSGHVWAHGDPVLCRWMQTGPGANMLEVIHRERRLGYLVGALCVSTTNPFPLTAGPRGDIYWEFWRIDVATGELTNLGTDLFPTPYTSQLIKAMANLNPYTLGSAQARYGNVAPDGSFYYASPIPRLIVVGMLVKNIVARCDRAGTWTYHPVRVQEAKGGLSYLGPDHRRDDVWYTDLDARGTFHLWEMEDRVSGDGPEPESHYAGLWRVLPGAAPDTPAELMLATYWTAADWDTESTSNIPTFFSAGQDGRWPLVGAQVVGGLGTTAFHTNVYPAYELYRRRGRYTGIADLNSSFQGYFYVPGIPSVTFGAHVAAWNGPLGFYIARRRAVFRCSGSFDDLSKWTQRYTWTGVNASGTGGLCGGIGEDFYFITNYANTTTVGNEVNAITYYGPAETTIGNNVRVLWRANAAGRRAVVAIRQSGGAIGTMGDMTILNGRVYFATTATDGSSVEITRYTNPYIACGVYEYDPANEAVRTVCTIPAGYTAGSWHRLYGPRRGGGT